MTQREFDYVIVGAGSAGCVLAGRLSEDPSVSVCLLESGATDDSALIHAPLGFALGATVGSHMWKYETTAQPELNGRKGFQPRGRVLGGSSSINAMVYARGHRSDYDGWAALGNPGWDYASVLPLFKRSENNECFGGDEFRGVGGPLNVARLRSPSPLGEAFLAACESRGIARTPDYNGQTMAGCWPAQVTQKNGERCSAAKAFLTPHLGRPNLEVFTRAHAQRIAFDADRAVAVRVRADGQDLEVRARREILLSAGAYGSPQLLLASGVGPGADLQALGIATRHDLPGVGNNLQDHVTSVLNFRSTRHDATLGLSARGGWALVRAISEWRRKRTGRITSNVAEAGAFLYTRDGLPAPDIEAELLVAMVDDHNRKMHWGHGWGVHVTLARPRSRGQVRLASPDTAQAPIIDPRYLSHPDDMPTLVAGTRKVLDIANAPALAPFRGKALYAIDANSDQDLEREIRRSADTEYHPCGTCRMGPAEDPTAVVDAALRVHGLRGLRVVDASIMPAITSANTNAPTIMIAERAVELLRQER